MTTWIRASSTMFVREASAVGDWDHWLSRKFYEFIFPNPQPQLANHASKNWIDIENCSDVGRDFVILEKTW
jgi:hypothetical protein